MKILIKYMLSTIFHKPIRLMVILFTICLSGAAVFASVSISDTMIKTTTNQWRSEYGYADIVIKPSLLSNSRYLDQFKTDQYESYFEYTVRKLSVDASISEHDIVLHGYTLNTLRHMLYLPFRQELNLFPFVGNKIIISAKYAQENKIILGDTLIVNINGNKHQFIVCGICPQNGPFAYERESFAAIIPFEKMQSCLGQLGRADTLYIGLKDKNTKSHMILKLSDLYREYSVRETYSVDHIRLQTNKSAVPFVFMSVLLCLMAVYVIYVIFQNIVIERMPNMGIFQAMGADRLNTNVVVLLEGAAYGVIGGVFSLGVGALILTGIVRQLYSSEHSSDVTLSVSPGHIALTLLISVGISIVGGYLSLRKYKALSIVGLIKQSTSEQTHSHTVLPFIALSIFIVSIMVLMTWSSQSGLTIYVLLVIIIMLSFLMASTFLYQQFSKIIKRAICKFKGFFKIVSLSIQNQRGFLIAATILSVIVATNIIINTITYSNDEGSRLYFDRFHYDIELSTNDLTRGKINFIEQLPGVLSVCANYYSGSTDVKGQSISIYRIQGIDTLKAKEFMDYDITSTCESPFNELEDGKSILLTNTLKNIYKIKENDSIVLKIYGYDGVYREIPYRVIGFFDDEYTKLGRYALISHKNFTEDFKAKQYSSFYVISNEVDKALKSIKNAYYDKQLQITTVQEIHDTAIEESWLIISAMRWISYISTVTGVLGMLFIMMLSFKNRIGELSIYSAMGFERGNIGKMLFAEMFLAGLAGLFTGIAMGAVISFIALPKLVYSLQIAMSIYFSPTTVINACLFGMGVCMVSGTIGVISFRRATLIGVLRCE